MKTGDTVKRVFAAREQGKSNLEQGTRKPERGVDDKIPQPESREGVFAGFLPGLIDSDETADKR